MFEIFPKNLSAGPEYDSVFLDSGIQWFYGHFKKIKLSKAKTVQSNAFSVFILLFYLLKASDYNITLQHFLHLEQPFQKCHIFIVQMTKK
jgi:hypothetical protein